MHRSFKVSALTPAVLCLALISPPSLRAELNLAPFVPPRTAVERSVSVFHHQGLVFWGKAGVGTITKYSSTDLEIDGSVDYSFLSLTLKGKLHYAIIATGTPGSLRYDVVLADKHWTGVAPWSVVGDTLVAANDGFVVSQRRYGGATTGIEVRVQFGANLFESVLLHLEY
jgi:hypothetical protein